MGQPAGGAGNGKEGGKEVFRDAELAVNEAGIEVDIGIDTLRPQPFRCNAFQLSGQVVEGVVAKLVKQLFGQLLQDHGPGILHLVFAVAKTHDLALFSDGPIQPGLHLIFRADLLEHLEHVFVGAAVEGARQGSHR